MKKHFILSAVVVVAIITVFIGYANQSAEGADVGDNGNVNPMAKYVGNQKNFPPPPFDVDIDFTALSGTNFDEEFSNVMFMSPGDYLGKTFRLIGPYSGFLDEDSNRYYHYVLVDDEAGCCIRYVEFAWNDGRVPAEYPEEKSIIDVAGEFSRYFDEGFGTNFHYLKVDGISVVRKK
ncbi:MAG: hypothetical protein FWG71_02785 [Synergistaceae bacterium]|nr:hypothetical protein [Synergistaceae bacterium]